MSWHYMTTVVWIFCNQRKQADALQFCSVVLVVCTGQPLLLALSPSSLLQSSFLHIILSTCCLFFSPSLPHHIIDSYIIAVLNRSRGSPGVSHRLPHRPFIQESRQLNYSTASSPAQNTLLLSCLHITYILSHCEVSGTKWHTHVVMLIC